MFRKIVVFSLLLGFVPIFPLGAETEPAPKAPPPGMAPPAQPPQPPEKLRGKALKEKEASIQMIQGIPEVPYQKIGPVWASKTSMKSTMKDLRKQAAKMGADAIVNMRVHTEKMQSTTYDPGWYGGIGPYGGWWGGMSYWGGFASTNTWNQPVVTGWAIKWTGTPPQNVKEYMPQESLEQEVENAPQ